MPDWTIRPAVPDDVTAACGVLHAAHAWNLSNGFNFTGGTTTPESLLERFRTASYFVAELPGGRIVGTVSIEPERPGDPHILERDPALPEPGDWVLHNLAVTPDCGGAGLGRVLLRHAEAAALREGGRRMILDTPENHPWLPAYYEKFGYRRFGHIRWEGKNYRSVLLGRLLTRFALAGDLTPPPGGAG